MAQSSVESPTTTSPSALQQRDLSPFAARYLFWLGVVNLFGLNLGGVLWIWFSYEIREHNSRFWMATLILCGIMVAAGLAAIGVAFVQGADGISLRVSLTGTVWYPSAWIIYAFSIVLVFVHLIPMIALLAPATRSRFDASK